MMLKLSSTMEWSALEKWCSFEQIKTPSL